MKKLFTPEQERALAEFEQAIAEVSAQLAIIKAIGIEFADRESLNADRQISCQRCREICAAYEGGQVGAP